MEKVFISYAKEDKEVAKKINHDLKNADISTWIDYKELLPGQNWKHCISEAIKDCSYFLALLSSHSVSKKGFVQKELKIGLELLKEFPPNKIFIIPVRVDDCIPNDEQLKYIHWADLFPEYEDGLRKIIRTLIPDADHIKKTVDEPVQSIRKWKGRWNGEANDIAIEGDDQLDNETHLNQKLDIKIKSSDIDIDTITLSGKIVIYYKQDGKKIKLQGEIKGMSKVKGLYATINYIIVGNRFDTFGTCLLKLSDIGENIDGHYLSRRIRIGESEKSRAFGKVKFKRTEI